MLMPKDEIRGKILRLSVGKICYIKDVSRCYFVGKLYNSELEFRRMYNYSSQSQGNSKNMDR